MFGSLGHSNFQQNFSSLDVSAQSYSALRGYVKEFLEPLSQIGLSKNENIYLSPNAHWDLKAKADLITGWVNFTLHSSVDTEYSTLEIPPSRNMVALWFKDSAAVLVSGFPDALPMQSQPHGAERLLVIDPYLETVQEIPFNYPANARIGVIENTNINKALISIRSGNHSHRTLYLLDLTSSEYIHTTCCGGDVRFNPVQQWKDGFIGLLDGNKGYGELVYLNKEGIFESLVAEKEMILRAVHATDEGFVLSYYLSGYHTVIHKSFENGDETILYHGDMVIENFKKVPGEGIVATVSRLDVSPLDIPCTKEGFLRASQETSEKRFIHEHREFQIDDGTCIPVEFYHPEVSHTNRMLISTYGTWGVIHDSRFDILRSLWLELGGSIAFIGVRGGGEKGAHWHLSGQGKAKSESIENLLEVVELMKNDQTLANHLFVSCGYSAGATIIAGALKQRADLFEASILQSGVYDMEHYPSFSFGAGWKNEFGDPMLERESFSYYSPLGMKMEVEKKHGRIMLVSGDIDQTVAIEHTDLFFQYLQLNRSSKDIELVKIPGFGHDLALPFYYPTNSTEHTHALDLLIKEIVFLRG